MEFQPSPRICSLRGEEWDFRFWPREEWNESEKMKEAQNRKVLVESSQMRVHILVKRLPNCFSFVFAPHATFILQLMTSNLT